MTIRLWKGYHAPELGPLIAHSWQDGILLVLCPPMLLDFSFLTSLPPGSLELFGTWTDEERATLVKIPRRGFDQFAERPVLGVFTSGTMSASPRLVLYSRKNVLASLSSIMGLFERTRIGHLFCYPQAFHTFGLTLGYLSAHIMGWELHTPEGKYGQASHGQRMALQETGVLTLGTPTHFFDLLSYVKKCGGEMTPSYSCIMGGASVSRELWLRVQNELKIAAPSIGYGCTEAAPGITHLPPGRAPLQDDEIGMPLSSIHSRISPEGVEIHGDSLCLAIVQNGRIDFPSTVIIRDRLESAPSGGWLYRGRLDLLMNRGGAKYSLEAIEKTLFDRLGLTAVACTVRDSRLGEDLGLAFMQGNENSMEGASAVLKEVYSLKLQPEKTRFVAEFPLNECSKLDRKSVWTLFQDESTIL
ncbi:MAG: AMP-binding protein [Bdellovibrionales bacterium]